MKIEEGYSKWINAPERKQSPEVDFGCWWSLNIDKKGNRKPPFWRVSWIKDTGELYAVCLNQDKFIVIISVRGREAIEDRMDGWADNSKEFSMDLRTWIGYLQNF